MFQMKEQDKVLEEQLSEGEKAGVKDWSSTLAV